MSHTWPEVPAKPQEIPRRGSISGGEEGKSFERLLPQAVEVRIGKECIAQKISKRRRRHLAQSSIHT